MGTLFVGRKGSIRRMQESGEVQCEGDEQEPSAMTCVYKIP